MVRWPALILSLFVCFSAQAAPQNNTDDIDKILAERGLIRQTIGSLEQARQTFKNKATDLVDNAMGFLGVPYRRGGNSAETGFDCSGFVRAIYGQTIGLVLPRRANDQAAATSKIDKNDLQPGDLVFFNTMRRAFSHVGIYVGDGKFIHSPRTGSEVRVEDMRTSYWQRRFNGARRVDNAADANADAAPNLPAGFAAPQATAPSTPVLQ